MRHVGFWRQIAAVLVDQLIIMLPSMVISVIYFYVAVASGVDPVTARGNSDLVVIALVLAFSAAYYIYLNGRHGVTVGRLLLKLKLTRDDEPNRDGIGYGRAAIRFFLFALAGGFVTVAGISVIPDAVGILIDAVTGATLLWVLIDPRRRTLEDVVMGTVLVHDPSGKFPSFDPDKIPTAKVRLYSFTALVVLNALASVYSALNR